MYCSNARATAYNYFVMKELTQESDKLGLYDMDPACNPLVHASGPGEDDEDIDLDEPLDDEDFGGRWRPEDDE